MKKYVYYINYTLDNFQKYNEEYFLKKGIETSIYLLINPNLLKPNLLKKINGGNRSVAIDSTSSTNFKNQSGGANENMTLSVPYKYFDNLINFLLLTKDSKETGNSDTKKKNIFMEAIDKIKIMVDSFEERWNRKGKEDSILSNKEYKKEKELTKEEKKILFSEDYSNIDKKKLEDGEKNMSDSISSLSKIAIEMEPYEILTEDEKTRLKNIESQEELGKKQLKIESNKPIEEFERTKTKKEFLEETIFENTREYKLLNR